MLFEAGRAASCPAFALSPLVSGQRAAHIGRTDALPARGRWRSRRGGRAGPRRRPRRDGRGGDRAAWNQGRRDRLASRPLRGAGVEHGLGECPDLHLGRVGDVRPRKGVIVEANSILVITFKAPTDMPRPRHMHRRRQHAEVPAIIAEEYPQFIAWNNRGI